MYNGWWVSHQRYWQAISSLLQVFGKENYNKENYKHKIEKMYFMKYTYLVEIHKCTPQKFAINVIVIFTTTKRQSTINTTPFNNWTQHAGKCETCERFQLLQKGIIGKWTLKLKAGQKGRPKNDVKDSTWIQRLIKFPFFSHKIWWYSTWSKIG